MLDSCRLTHEVMSLHHLIHRNLNTILSLFKSSYPRNYLFTVSKFSNSSKTEAEAAVMISEDRIIWMDLEMTGLDINCDHIMEASCLITDKHLNPINEGVNVVISQPDVVLQNMNPWCIEHHSKSGLTDLSRKSKTSLKLAEMELLSYVRQHTKPGKCPLAGNTVHEDKKFLAKYMPELTEHFHYRIIDVSTIKELCKRWYPKEFMNTPRKTLAHRSLQDIKESIAELQYYRTTVFKQTDELK